MPPRCQRRRRSSVVAGLVSSAAALAVGLRLMFLPADDGTAGFVSSDPRRLGGTGEAQADSGAQVIDEEHLEVAETFEANFGRELFYDRSPGGARAACDALDNIALDQAVTARRGRRADDDGGGDGAVRPACRFTDCMDALESAQREYKQKSFHWQKTAQSKDESSTCASVASFHVAWLTDSSGDGLLTPAARLALWSTVRAYQRGCAQITVWVRTNDVREAVTRQLERSWPDSLARAIMIEPFDALRLADNIAAIFPPLRGLIESESSRILLGRIQTRLESSSENYYSAPSSAARDSDLLRVFVLAARGGVYLDLDVLLLRPLTPLISNDFYYRWASQPYCNTAVMHLRRGSSNAEKLIRAALARPSHAKGLVADFLHPESISRHSQRMGLTIETLPSAYFDPIWVLNDESHRVGDVCANSSRERYGVGPRIGGFFTSNNTVLSAAVRGGRSGNNANGHDPREVFFPGPFAFHWHNQWGDNMMVNSTAGIFLHYFEPSTF